MRIVNLIRPDWVVSKMSREFMRLNTVSSSNGCWTVCRDGLHQFMAGFSMLPIMVCRNGVKVVHNWVFNRNSGSRTKVSGIQVTVRMHFMICRICRTAQIKILCHTSLWPNRDTPFGFAEISKNVQIIWSLKMLTQSSKGIDIFHKV